MDDGYQALLSFFRTNDRCAIAFSGGVDSTLLLHAALTADADVRAYYIRSIFQPAWEYEDAVLYAKAMDVPFTVLSLDMLAYPKIIQNNKKRCYYCKHAILTCLISRARSDGYPLLLDGTNASDDMNDRPGMQALDELSIISPLRLCGLTKNEIYSLSSKFGLPSASKPAYSCLATRIPYGRAINSDLLSRVESAEKLLFSYGFSDFRVRLEGEDALLQFSQVDRERFYQQRDTLVPKLQAWFYEIQVDVDLRKGTGVWTNGN